MIRDRHEAILVGLLAAAGLALYLWPAVAAPVVLWSDSTIDLDWAARGIGILSPAPTPPSPHPAKPGWLVFLRAVHFAGDPAEAPRRAVILQSVILWGAMAWAAVLLGRRAGAGWGLAFYLATLGLLRLRDSASAVMSEALAAALLLAICAVLLRPPRGAGAFLLGISIAALFLVRPNCGALALGLAAASFLLHGLGRRLLLVGGSFLVVFLPFWIATRTSGDPWRGLSPAFPVARAPYAWGNSVGLEIDESNVDARRRGSFRLLHGLLGTEYSDDRWSGAYGIAAEVSKAVTPFLLLAAVAVLVAAPWRPGGSSGAPALLGIIVLAGAIAQSWVLGPLPRFALPFLPLLVLYACAAAPDTWSSGMRRPFAAAAVFATLVGLAWPLRHVLAREWGLVESAGVRITQTIPKGSLPETAPATLHIRMAPALLPTAARIEVLAPGGVRLYDSSADPDRRLPYITMPLSGELLAESRRRDLELSVVSGGTYDDFHYLLFPVIPRPWGPAASRDGSAMLSPGSGAFAGGLDWWAHAGAP